MLFNKIKGHDKVISKLTDMCVNRSFSGPYLFKGPESVGKFTIARHISKYLTCISSDLDPGCRCGNCRIFPKSPDYMEINLGSDIIKIEHIEPIEEYVSLAPFRGDRKVVVINNAEKINLPASNRLLKLFEVDRTNVVYFLISSKMNKILPTVVSRCHLISFTNLDPEHISDILGKVSVSEKDIIFLRKINNYIDGGILSDYYKYLSISKRIPSFFKSFKGRDEGNILSVVDEMGEEGNLAYFLELLIVYVNDILKMHYSSVDEISFYRNLDDIEGNTEIWTEEVCLAMVARLRDCLKTHNLGLNLNIKSNVKSSLSWVFLLLNSGAKK